MEYIDLNEELEFDEFEENEEFEENNEPREPLNVHLTLNELIATDLLTIRKNKKVSIIDPFETTKNLKQIAEMFQMLYETKKSISVTFLVSNKYFKTTIQDFIKKADFKHNINIVTNFKDVSENTFLFVCQPLNRKELNFLMKSAFNKNIFLINVVTTNSTIYSNKSGSYLTFNEHNKLKKLFFLVTFINNLLSINSNETNKQI